MTFPKLAEIAYPFVDEGPDWKWCMEHSNFQHRDADACEFIVHIGEPDYWHEVLNSMDKEGCTEEFIAEYVAAKDAGAIRVLFYAD